MLKVLAAILVRLSRYTEQQLPHRPIDASHVFLIWLCGFREEDV